ncbi:5-oxoprolinase subunit PxpA [Pseudoneobacillus sp. C159]
MVTVDLNCDLGESFGAYQIGQDEEIMKYITSANIACGFHAGDPIIMRKTVEMAIKHGVKIGAHPGFPDLQGFGRRNMNLSPEEVYSMVLYQIGALEAFVRVMGATLHHVKPHGALYNMSATNQSFAEAIAKAIFDFNPELSFYGLANSAHIEAGNKYHLKMAQEVFADRTYQADGTLTPRNHANALVTDKEKAIQQTVNMIKDKQVTAVTGETISITADTICIHGDGIHAVSFAKNIKNALENEGITLKKAGL